MPRSQIWELRLYSKRHLRGRSPAYLRAYIGRTLIRTLAAEDLLVLAGEEGTLAPSLYRALENMIYLAKENYDEVDP